MTFDADQMPPDEYDEGDAYDEYEDEPLDDAPYDNAPIIEPPARRLPESPPQPTESGHMMPQVPIAPQFASEQSVPQRSWLLDMLGIEDPLVLGLLVLAIPLVLLGLLLPPFTVINVLDEQINPAPDTGADTVAASNLPVPQRGMVFQPFAPDDPRVTIGALTVAAPAGTVPADYQISAVGMAPQTYVSGWTPETGWHCGMFLPRHLQLASDVYSLAQRGTPPPSLTLAISATPDLITDAGALDVRIWNDDGALWEAAAATPTGDGAFVLDLPTLPRCVAVFARASDLPTALNVTVRPGDVYAPELLPQGTRILAGTLHPAQGGAVQVVRGPAFDLRPGSSILVLAQNFTDPAVLDVDTVNAILADPTQRTMHAHALAAFITANPDYVGLVVDYRAVDPAQREAYTQFVTELARLLHWNRRTLTVILPVPGDLLDQTTWGTGAYDWSALGQIADNIVVTLPPSGKPFGPDADSTPSEAIIDWALTMVDPQKLSISLDALSVEAQMTSGQIAPITFSAALDDLGEIQLQPSNTLEPLQAVTADLTPPAGIMAEFGRDSYVDVPYIVYRADGQILRTMWLTDAQTLIARLTHVEQLGVGGVLVTNLMAPGTVPGVENALLRYVQGNAVENTALELEIEWTVRQGDEVTAQQVAPIGDLFGFTVLPRGNALTVEARFNEILVASEAATVVGISAGDGESAPVAALSRFGVGLHLSSPSAIAPALEGLTGDWVALDIMFRPGSEARAYQTQLDAVHAISPTTKAYVRLLVEPSDIRNLPTARIYQREYALFAAELTRYGANAIEIFPNQTDLWPSLDQVVHVGTAYNFIKSANPQTLVVARVRLDNRADEDYFEQVNRYDLTRFVDCMGIEVRADVSYGTPEETLAPMVLQVHQLLGREYPVCPTISYWAAQDDLTPTQGTWLLDAIVWARTEPQIPLVLVWTADTSAFTPGDFAAGYALVRPDGSCPACDLLRPVFDATGD